MTLNSIDFSTVRAARQLMSDEEAATALALGLEAERNNGAAAVAFWRFIHCVLKRPQPKEKIVHDAR